MIQLHPIKKSDSLESVVASMNKAFQRQQFLRDDLGRINLEELLQLISLPKSQLFLAKKNKSLAGGVLRKVLDDRHIEMSHFWVDPQFRGKDVGRQILQNMEEKLKEEKAPLTAIIKIIPFQQDRLIQFYEGLGYRYTGLVEHPTLEDKRRFIYPEFWSKISLKIYEKQIY